ncbi:MAG: hypothetical protein JWO05_2141 [Gemmatimonadetes bacterium]|nr:hypothetical protein [Gemmatimonadota bacterium]
MRNPLASLAALALLALALLPAPRVAGAQSPSPRSLGATRASGVIHLDGRLDEADWARAEVAGDFTQRHPTPGVPATYRTEIRVLYDAGFIYVGARMFDPHPDSIAAPLARKDPGDVSSDWIDVIFDSYHDHRTAYRFGVNPAGTKLDVYHFNDEDDDSSWDPLWDVVTRIDSAGWVAEYRIPLSQLRFHASAGEQVWGLQFYRAVARRDEWSHWVPYLPTTPGFVSAFGELHGLVGLAPPSPVEVTPYVVSRSTGGADAGADLRLGLGSGLSLTGTINPDFGQVEVDPAVINLSEVETFFPEKRPFFLEGSGIFEFGAPVVSAAYGFSRFVHWRRIGETPIVGAAKLSGQLEHGWSVGLVDASTRATSAHDHYFVGRAKRDVKGGRSSFGFIATAANKAARDAYLLGVDGRIASSDRRWILGGHVAGSGVRGGTQEILDLQRSSARYLQRPDAGYLGVDSARTALRGVDGAVSVIYNGSPWFGSMQYHETSAGYESNDVGYLARADVRSLTGAYGLGFTGMKRAVRDLRVVAIAQEAANHGGDVIYQRAGLTSSAMLRSLWSLSGRLLFRPAFTSDRLTRGGPRTAVPAQWEVGGSVGTDSRRPLLARFNAYREGKGMAGSEAGGSVDLVMRPRPSLQLLLSPSVERIEDAAQFVRSVTDDLGPTFGRRYVFATLRQSTAYVDVRADWTLTPTLSFQLFAQPFHSNAHFADYKELRAARSYAFDVYGRDRGSISAVGAGRFEVDPDGAGPARAFLIGGESNQSSFSAREVRVNGVLRWEYRAGSVFYAVWQQAREQGAERHALFLKGSYRWGR